MRAGREEKGDVTEAVEAEETSAELNESIGLREVVDDDNEEEDEREGCECRDEFLPLEADECDEGLDELSFEVR